MKNVLLLMGAAMASLSINAQSYCYFPASEVAQGLNSSAVSEVSAGAVFGTVGDITITAGADDSYKLVSLGSPKVNADLSYTKISFDGTVLDLAQSGCVESDYNGIQGNTNPKDVDGSNPATSMSVPTTGAFFVATVEGTTGDSPIGYLYVIHKATYNKQYCVFEGSSAIAYEFAMGVSDETSTDDTYPTETIYYDFYDKCDELGYLVADSFPSGIQSVVTITGSSATSNGLSYIGFPVYGGLTYTFSAAGSKMSALGVLFSETEISKIVLMDADEAYTLVLKDSSTPISNIKADEESYDGPIYNLAGQKVSENTKGLLIKNGKLILNK